MFKQFVEVFKNMLTSNSVKSDLMNLKNSVEYLKTRMYGVEAVKYKTKEAGKKHEMKSEKKAVKKNVVKRQRQAND